MKKGLIIAIILVAVAAAGAVWYYYAHPQTQPIPPIQQEQPVQPEQVQPEQVQPADETTTEQPDDTLLQAHKHQRTIETNRKVVYEPEKVANPILVGLWVENGTKHYKIYLDDACDEESYFWGKEWDEEQGIFEEDLTYHGNGWFKWSKTHDELTEIYLSDQGNMVIPTRYRIQQLNDSILVCQSLRTFNYQRIKL